MKTKDKFGTPYSIEECITYKQMYLTDADPYLLELFQWLINMATVGEQALKESKSKEVWTVHYGNYFPREIDSYWDSEAEANVRCELLNIEDATGAKMWQVESTV